jgi:MFS family permease
MDVIARSPVLRRILLASFISGLGDRMHQVALAALILSLTGSLVKAGLVFVVSTVPYVLFGLVVGALVDRWDRRSAMVSADLARAALVAAIPVAAAISLPLVYLLLFATACGRMVFTPAQQAVLPELVDADDLGAANSLVRAAQYLTDLIGYPIAAGAVVLLTGALGTTWGTQVAFALDAASFLASALLLWQLPADGGRAARGAVGRLREQIADGLRFMLGHPQIRANTLLFVVGPLLLGSLHTLWVGFAWRVSNTGALGFGLTEALTGAGVLLGVCALPRASARLNKGRIILIGFALYGGAILAVGTTASLPIAAALALFAGAGNVLFLVPSVTLVQQQTPADLRGRVLGVRLTLTYAAFAGSNALAGGLSDVVGVSLLMMLLGGGAVAMASLAYLVPSAREAI